MSSKHLATCALLLCADEPMIRKQELNDEDNWIHTVAR